MFILPNLYFHMMLNRPLALAALAALSLFSLGCTDHNPRVSRGLERTFNDHHTGKGQSSSIPSMVEAVTCEAKTSNPARKCTVTFHHKTELPQTTVLLRPDPGPFPAYYKFDQSVSYEVDIETSFDGASMTREQAAAAMNATNMLAYSHAMTQLGEKGEQGYQRYDNLQSYSK